MVIVMGPTPPGTGVMAPATGLASSKSTSPTSLKPDFLVASGMGFVPTSMTAAPGFSHEPFTILGFPQAATTISASRTTASMSLVLAWQMVTVASLLFSSIATGMPTMFERPTTTARLPLMSMPHRSSKAMQPRGVQGANNGSRPFMARRPMLNGWKPSTSLLRLIAPNTVASSTWGGSGNCTKMPWTSGLSLNLLTVASTSSCVAEAGRLAPKEAMPTSSHAFCFMRTYVWLSPRSPTMTTARPGTLLYFSFMAATWAVISSRICAATALPSMMFPFIRLMPAMFKRICTS
mmetsp:Transcript_194/g.427  ORF Transcript_194/g.427 Transcript_194/m.427 type:complete len:292 (-) Transcript_194:8-883(-)